MVVLHYGHGSGGREKWVESVYILEVKSTNFIK